MNDFLVLDDRIPALQDAAFNYTSQFGEDGFIDAALRHIGTANRWCFEVGAADGKFYSNTLRLREQDWNAVLIEADDANFEKLKAYASDRVQVVNQRIRQDDLDCILSECGAPEDLDLGVIDIDGQDYYAWRGLFYFRPRLILVEYSPYGTPDDLPTLNGEGQAGLNPILALGKEKGYVPLVQTYCNVLFVREDCL